MNASTSTATSARNGGQMLHRTNATYSHKGSSKEPIAKRNGQRIRVLCQIDLSVEDEMDLGKMFRIRFVDGKQADAYEDEIVYDT